MFIKPVALQDRAKVITRRRPPSRKARRSAALSASISFEDTSSPTSPDLPSITDLESDNQPKKSSDLFGNDDLFAEGSSTKLPVPSAATSHQSDDLFSKGLFGSSSAKTKSEPETKSDKVDSDDIFSSSGARTKKAQGEEDIFGDSKAKKAVAADDLFSIGDSKSKLDTKKVNEKASKDEDEDDLFSSGPVSKKDSSSKSATSENSSSKVSTTSSATSSGSKSSKAATVAADDDDDIFADSSLNKKKGMKSLVDSFKLFPVRMQGITSRQVFLVKLLLLMIFLCAVLKRHDLSIKKIMSYNRSGCTSDQRKIT